jgi:hypothetical protein
MQMEHWILIAMWLFGTLVFFLFVPLKDMRKGIFAFLMFQAIIWISDMSTFAMDWLHSPVHLFPKATDLPLTLDYFFYPVLFALYYVNKKSKDGLWYRFKFFFVWISVITFFDSMIERYTNLLEYDTMTWYWIWLYFAFLYYVGQVCCNWFFKDKALFQTERRWQTNEN